MAVSLLLLLLLLLQPLLNLQKVFSCLYCWLSVRQARIMSQFVLYAVCVSHSLVVIGPSRVGNLCIPPLLRVVVSMCCISH
jgi:hypothetical protein